jgi:ATP-dependent Clp protease ATP-binding subunit ClpA
MQQSPEIENIVERAIAEARARQHEYVTVEHLLLALVTHAPFKKCLSGFNIDVDMMTAEVAAYLKEIGRAHV